MKKKLLLSMLLLGSMTLVRGQGNYSSSGSESVNFGTIDLGTPGGQTWATERQALPGYFSAVGTAVYTGASDAANINGYVKHYADAANQSFTFPVGSGSELRTLATGGTIPSNAQFAAAWISGDPSGALDPTNTGAAGGAHSISAVGAGILSVSPVGQWDWQDLNGTGSGVTISVSIPNMASFATPSNLRLVGWNGTEWVNLSESTGASDNTAGTLLSGSMISGISAVAIGSNSLPLPVKLISFTAEGEGCSAVLKWKTTEESNSSHFDIEQSSDGKNFVKVGTVTSENAASGYAYSTVIAQEDQNAYYRLKMVDLDNTYAYSRIITYKSTCATGSGNGQNIISVFPNPVSTGEALKVEIVTAYRGAASLQVINTSGTQISGKAVQVTSGVNRFETFFSNLPAGIYYLRAVDGSGTDIVKTQKFIKQ